MSNQELAPEKPRMGKTLLIAAIVTWGVSVVGRFIVPFAAREGFLSVAIVIYFLLSCGAAYFYLKERAAVCARALGILGGLLGCGVLVPHFYIIPLPMAIGGAVLAPKKPKLAGSLMLVSAIGWWIFSVFLTGLALAFSNGSLPPWYEDATFFMPPLLASSFLLSGSVLAFTSQRKRPLSRKIIIAIFFAAFPLGLGFRHFALAILGPF